jgi:hypothetical protein
MKDSIINAFDTFQIADFDDDMVGMCKALVDWMKVLRFEIPGEEFPDTKDEIPHNFYKLDPHQPKMELRRNFRKIAAHYVKNQQEIDFIIQVKNIYIVVLMATYIYHMPTEKMVEASLQDKEFTREEAKEMLLADNMSPNWLKEPSGKDFTAIML